MSASSLAFLTQIVDEHPNPMFVKDRELRYVLVNAALLRLAGVSRADVIGKTDHEVLPKARADSYRASDEECLATGAEVTVDEEAMSGTDGVRRIVSTRKVALRGEDGGITHLIGVITDITRRKLVEEALRLSTEELEQRVADRTHALAVAQDDLVRKERLAVLGRLAGGVAHQVRNPLGAIKNAAYVVDRRLREAVPPPFTRTEVKDEVSHAIEIIHDEVQRANRIITDLLDYARVRAPVRQLTPLREVVERALDATDLPAAITVVRALPELSDLALDADQLQGALFNILRNAIEAMPEGGTLTIAAELRDGACVVTIGDTGTGIPEEVRGRLFEPLITTKPLGLGLGLVTARTLIEGQGGTIACVRLGAESEAGGACFAITLPLLAPT